MPTQLSGTVLDTGNTPLKRAPVSMELTVSLVKRYEKILEGGRIQNPNLWGFGNRNSPIQFLALKSAKLGNREEMEGQMERLQSERKEGISEGQKVGQDIPAMWREELEIRLEKPAG